MLAKAAVVHTLSAVSALRNRPRASTVLFAAILWALVLACRPVRAEKSPELPLGPQTPLFQACDLTEEGSFTGGVEGPAVAADGTLYAVNFARQHTIGMVTPQGKASIFVELPSGSTGNGIRFGSGGEMYIADYTGHNVLRVDMKTRKISVFAHDDRMNQPNDLAITANDILFASDPNWDEGTGQLWRINRDGSADLLEQDMGTTNGLEVSPDGKRLYLAESVQRTLWVYDLNDRGELSNKRLLAKFDDWGADGIRCDERGNVYMTMYGKGSIGIVSPEGKILRTIPLPAKNPSNIAFGGADGKTCFVTLHDRKNVAVFRTDTPGRSFVMHRKQ